MAYRVTVLYDRNKGGYPATSKDIVIRVVRQQSRDVIFQLFMRDLTACIHLSNLFENRSLIDRTVHAAFTVYNSNLMKVLETIGIDNISNKEVLIPIRSIRIGVEKPEQGNKMPNEIEVLVCPSGENKTSIYSYLIHRLTHLISFEKEVDVHWHLEVSPFGVTIDQPLSEVIIHIEALTGVVPAHI